MSKKFIVIFVSGNGTNLQYIIDAIENDALCARISCVICNNSKAYAIKRAQHANIPILVCKNESSIINNLNNYKFDLIILAGYMKILSKMFIDFYKNSNIPIINLHPALPGQFPGKNAIAQSFAAYQQGSISETGCEIQTNQTFFLNLKHVKEINK